MDKASQLPVEGSRENEILRAILDFYPDSPSKHRFEALAELIAEHLLKSSGSQYLRGWITPRAGDRGSDFIGRIDLGRGETSTKIVVIGQAKCEKPSVATGGNRIARTVARVKRGWVAAYATTSYFSETVQREILEDAYPILLINGLEIANEVLKLAQENDHSSVADYITSVDATYQDKVSMRRPEEILSD